MELWVVGSYDAVRGFELAGVGGESVDSAETLHRALEAALADEAVGIVLVTEDVAALDREYVERLKHHSSVPLLIEIPGPTGASEERPSLGEVIQRTTGVRV
jgi:vacuolar-type H+-ATPase subunit F/Vma7